MLRTQITGIVLGLLLGPSDVPAAGFWDDRPVKIIQNLDMQFPPSLLMDGITRGEVRAVLEVDSDGKLTDFLVTVFTHQALAMEMQRSLTGFTFEPARQRGAPIACRFETVFSFEARGVVLSLTPSTSATAQFRGTLAEPAISLLVRPIELDRPVAVRYRVRPFHPGRSLTPPIPEGKVQVDFFVDGDGRPRMPVVLRASHERFAVAAVDALLQWRFEPPTRQGQPVLVHVTQEFVFSSESPPPAG